MKLRAASEACTVASRDPEFSRLDRVAATIRRVLGAPINEIARAQNAGLTTITRVDLSPDLRHAGIFLSIYGNATDQREFIRQIADQAANLQHMLGRQLRTKRTPKLAFRLDDGIAREDRINRLLANKSTDEGVI